MAIRFISNRDSTTARRGGKVWSAGRRGEKMSQLRAAAGLPSPFWSVKWDFVLAPQGSGGAHPSPTPSRGGETAAAEHAVEVLGLRLIEGCCRGMNRVDFGQGDLHRRAGADLVN